MTTDEDVMRPLALAAKTADAYSADQFGPVLWVQAAQMLCGMGLSDAQVEVVLRSKMTRWCRDAYGDPATYIGKLGALVEDAKLNGDLSEYAAA